MKKELKKLKPLKIVSFITNEDQIRGGAGGAVTSCVIAHEFCRRDCESTCVAPPA